MRKKIAKIGDVVDTPYGKGRVVRGEDHGKKLKARGSKWVFLFFPENLYNRVILMCSSEVFISE